MTQYTAGTLAYIDSFSCGLVPCKVIRVVHPGNGQQVCGESELVVKVTANRGHFRRGEELTERAYLVVPRPHIRRRQYHYRINTLYEWR